MSFCLFCKSATDHVLQRSMWSCGTHFNDPHWRTKECYKRELNAANERIKLLEEAGNNLLWNFCPEYTSDFTESQSDALKQWNKAKKDNP